MAYVPVAHITINGLAFSRVNSIKIESSSEQLSDTAIIKVPSTARLKKTDQITDIETAKTFKAGDKVVIKIGYGKADQIPVEFEGYVKRVNFTTPVEIECEDSVYILRQKAIKKSWKKTTLKQVINYLIADTNITVAGVIPEINFTSFYLKDVNAAFALQKLRDEYGLSIYFLSLNELFVGFTDAPSRGEIIYNIGDDDTHYSNIIKPNLKYRNADDVKLKIKAIHIYKDNTRTEVEVGDKDGELRTLYFYDIENVAELEKLAKEEMQKYKHTGYQGSLKSFLIPIAKVGMIANIHDAVYPERSGRYKIKRVVTSFGSGGGKRNVELGIKV